MVTHFLRSHQNTVEEILQKQSEECARLRKRLEEENEEAERDYKFGLDRARVELEQVKEEKETLDDLLQSSQSDCNTLRNRMKEKGE